MTKKQNILLKASIAIAVLFAIAPASNAMHIMEGYLQATFCIARRISVFLFCFNVF